MTIRMCLNNHNIGVNHTSLTKSCVYVKTYLNWPKMMVKIMGSLDY